MSTITVDDTILTQLKQAGDVAEVRDAEGALLGYFAPAATENARLYARAFALFDPEEIKQRKCREAGHSGITLAQVKQRLQSLGSKA